MVFIQKVFSRLPRIDCGAVNVRNPCHAVPARYQAPIEHFKTRRATAGDASSHHNSVPQHADLFDFEFDDVAIFQLPAEFEAAAGADGA